MTFAEIAVALLFWACVAAVFYAYLGYPVVVYGLSCRFGRDREAPVCTPDDLPTLALLIAAHDEEAVIDARIRNALALDYPSEKREIVVASDGSSDGTAAIVRGYAGRGVRLLDYPRRGKAATLNAALAELTGELVLFSDANTDTDPAAARKLAQWFRDPRVGVACGRLVLTDPRPGRNADGLYWKYETFLKRCESKLGAVLGASGALYALRRELYVPIPDDTIADDFVIPLLARLRTGCAVVYDDEAIAREETAPGLGDEYRRRARIGAGGFQAIGLLQQLMHPRQGWLAFTFASHKLLRWLCPFCLPGMLLGSAALSHMSPYRLALIAQLAFYLASFAAILLPPGLGALKPLRLTTMFTLMNAALLVGFGRWLAGTQKGAWQRTARAAEWEGATR